MIRLDRPFFKPPKSFFLIAGPCVIESYKQIFTTAKTLKRICQKLKLRFIFKASYDKANRSSLQSFRGQGMAQGLKLLAQLRNELEIPILTDVHSIEEAELAAKVVDVLQIPAFLCRQTDLLLAAGRTGKWVNVKKGQFLSPRDMDKVIEKIERGAKSQHILLTERGTTFGYNNLVVDFRGIPIMKQTGYPVIFDATHSVQLPGAEGDRSGGEREFVAPLARAAIAAGADGLFIETHPNPQQALSDGANMVPLSEMESLLKALLKLRKCLD
jgi:2-dehydro-3-deoxyphosphooctonate aldolase (KDO 8-P synthase)